MQTPMHMFQSAVQAANIAAVWATVVTAPDDCYVAYEEISPPLMAIIRLHWTGPPTPTCTLPSAPWDGEIPF